MEGKHSRGVADVKVFYIREYLLAGRQREQSSSYIMFLLFRYRMSNPQNPSKTAEKQPAGRNITIVVAPKCIKGHLVHLELKHVRLPRTSNLLLQRENRFLTLLLPQMPPLLQKQPLLPHRLHPQLGPTYPTSSHKHKVRKLQTRRKIRTSNSPS